MKKFSNIPLASTWCTSWSSAALEQPSLFIFAPLARRSTPAMFGIGFRRHNDNDVSLHKGIVSPGENPAVEDATPVKRSSGGQWSACRMYECVHMCSVIQYISTYIYIYIYVYLIQYINIISTYIVYQHMLKPKLYCTSCNLTMCFKSDFVRAPDSRCEVCEVLEPIQKHGTVGNECCFH